MSEESVFPDQLRVINIGLEQFADDLRQSGAVVVQVQWRPPAGGNEHLASLLDCLDDD